MRRVAASLACLALALTGSGCHSLLPTSHESFGEWLLGDPEGDYQLVDLEGTPAEVRLAHTTFAWPLFALRDGLKLGIAPIVAPYYLFAGQGWIRPRAPSGPHGPSSLD